MIDRPIILSEQSYVHTGAIQSLDLRDGPITGTTRIALRGRGPLLTMPNPQTLTLPLSVQLQNSHGGCWEARYSPPTRRQSSKAFLDNAD